MEERGLNHNEVRPAHLQPRLLSPAQIRAARAMLGWSMLDLAQAARVSVSTIKRMEMSQPQPVSDSAFDTVRSTLEQAGVQFSSDLHGEGVWKDRRRAAMTTGASGLAGVDPAITGARR
jgi:ribosome-binding protein aMBF1 (putative translation factor)